MANLQDIADEAGVSVFTASRVLNGKTKDVWPSAASRAERIRAIARKYGYLPSGHARAIRRQKSMAIGVLLRNSPQRPLHYLDAFEAVLGINQRLASEGYVATLVRIDDVQADLSQGSRVFQERVLDGMIVLDSLPQEVYQQVERRMEHCVWLESNHWESQRCIRRDEVHAGRLVAHKLLQAGYRRLVWVATPVLANSPGQEHFSRPDRLRGAREVAEQAGVSLECVELPALRDPFGAEAYGPIFQPEVGIIAYDAMQAQRLANSATQVGRIAGRDFGLAACDRTHHTQITFPDLSCIEVSRFEMGYEAAEMMVRLIEEAAADCPSRLVQGSWVDGQTIGSDR